MSTVSRQCRPLLLIFSATILLMGCAGNPWWLPTAHRITIQQGNLVKPERLESVEAGMPREQVRNLLGSPVVDSPFDTDRWDYVFTRGPAGSAIPARRVSVFFVDDLVSRIDNNAESVSGERPPQRRWWEFFSRRRAEG